MNVLRPICDHIPNELKTRKQWVCWLLKRDRTKDWSSGYIISEEISVKNEVKPVRRTFLPIAVVFRMYDPLVQTTPLNVSTVRRAGQAEHFFQEMWNFLR